eukprot:scaffold13341_cov101-Isochrysis_galbana.AAC.7
MSYVRPVACNRKKATRATTLRAIKEPCYEWPSGAGCKWQGVSRGEAGICERGPPALPNDGLHCVAPRRLPLPIGRSDGGCSESNCEPEALQDCTASGRDVQRRVRIRPMRGGCHLREVLRDGLCLSWAMVIHG